MCLESSKSKHKPHISTIYYSHVLRFKYLPFWVAESIDRCALARLFAHVWFENDFDATMTCQMACQHHCPNLVLTARTQMNKTYGHAQLPQTDMTGVGRQDSSCAALGCQTADIWIGRECIFPDPSFPSIGLEPTKAEKYALSHSIKYIRNVFSLHCTNYHHNEDLSSRKLCACYNIDRCMTKKSRVLFKLNNSLFEENFPFC